MQTDDDLTSLFERAVADLAPDVNVIVHKAEQLGRRLRRRLRIRRAAGTGVTVIAVAGVGAGAWLAHPLGSLGAYANAGAGNAGSPASSAHPLSTPASHLRERAAEHAASQQPTAATPTASTATAPTPMTRRQMLRTLRSLLPPSAVLTDDPTAATKPGSLEVNYNDGNGKVDVMIDITPFSEVVTSDPGAMIKQPGTSASLPTVLKLSCPNPLWTDEGTRPVGALPISCAIRNPAGGGIERDAVMYADGYGFYGYDIYYQRPDDVEVFIQVGNGYFDPYLPHVDRATPPGSMALWEQVVDSPAWRA
jgi:hypothetical protein